MAINYSDWLKRLRDVAAQLSRHPIDLQLQIGEPFSAEEMLDEEAYFAGVTGKPDFRFHESLRALYLATRSISFRWQTRFQSEMQPMSGGLELATLALLYEGDPEANAPETWHGRWRALDEWSPITQVVIRFSESDGAASLAFRSIEGGTETITPLDLSIDDYFELSLASCCVNEWPLLFASGGPILSDEQIEDLLGRLAQISPPADVAALQLRLRRK